MSEQNPGYPQVLRQVVEAGEDWLMDRALHYAKQHDYAKYTSTLKEAWRLSIAGTSQSLVQAIAAFGDTPQTGPDDRYEDDPCSSFARVEAQRHRARGVTLAMFLGLMKYFRWGYVDLVRERCRAGAEADWCERFVIGFFDRVEVAFCAEWARANGEDRLTELQGTNRRLANEKNKYLTVFESLSPPVFLVGTDGRVENLNFTAARLFEGSITPGSLYYSPNDQTHDIAWLAAELRAFHRDTVPEQIIEKPLELGGQTLCFEVQLCRMLDISDKFTGTLVILNDITRRKATELALERTNAELRSKSAEMEQFVYTVSHDLKSPLVTINGFASHIRQDLNRGATDRLGAFLDRIQNAAGQMRLLIEELLEVSRIGRVVCTPDVVDIGEVARYVGKLYEDRLAAGGIAFEVQESMPRVCVDRARIVQVFDNLVVNAIKYGCGSPSPRISVGSVTAEGEIRFFVSDNGKGIAPAHHERVFQLFNRLDRGTEGTGVGLTIVRRVAELHEGRAWVESEPGRGATFWLAFPVGLHRRRPCPTKVADVGLPADAEGRDSQNTLGRGEAASKDLAHYSGIANH